MHAASGLAAASEQSRMNSSLDCEIFTTPLNWSTTSSTGVLTMGLPVAMYSSALVGLMYSVASLMAKGIRHTSNFFTYAGRSE